MTFGKKKYIKKLLLAILLLAGAPVAAQTWNMQNGDTLWIDACQHTYGTIYDNGGQSGSYSSSFDGGVIISANYGSTINLSITYATEWHLDYITILDNNTEMPNMPLSGNGTVNLTCTSGRAKIFFHSDWNNTYNGFTIQYTVTAGGASAGGVQNVTASAINAHGATLQWTSGSAGPFHILCDNPYSDTLSSASTSYTLTRLNPSMRHHVEIVANGQEGTNCARGQVQFRTACGTGRLPLIEDFNDVTTDSMTPCWIRSVNFDDAFTLPRVVSFENGDKAQMLSCGNSNRSGHFGMVVTPKIVSGTQQWLVSFKLRVSHSGTRIVVGFCDSTSDETQSFGFQAVETLTPSSNNWVSINKSYTVPAGKCRLAFRMEQSMQGSSTGRMAYIDNLVIASCAVREPRVMHPDSSSFDVYWTTEGTPSVTVRVRPEWGPGAEQVFHNATSPLTVTNLNPNTRYEVTLYPICDGAQQYPVVAYGTTTANTFIPSSMCMVLPLYNQATAQHVLPTGWSTLSSGNNTAEISGSQLLLYNGCYLVSPPLTDLGGKELKIRFTSGYDNVSNLVVGTMTYPDDPTTFTPLDTFEVRNLYYPDTTFRFPNNITDHYLAFKSLCPNYASVTLSMLSINNGHITGVRATRVRTTEITLQWDPSPYDSVVVAYYRGSTYPNNPPVSQIHFDTIPNTNHHTITGLSRHSSYVFYVYPLGSDYCAPIDERQVSTARRDYDLPYCEDFEPISYSEPFFPDENHGWNTYNSVLNCPIVSVEYYHSQTNSLKMASGSGGYVSTSVLPDIDGVGGSVISFWAYSHAPASAVVVGYYSIQNPVFTTIDTLHIAGNAGWRHYVCNIPANVTGRLALQYTLTDCEGVYYAWIDDLILGSANYGDFTFANLSGNSIDIVWQAAGTTDSITVMMVHMGDTVWASGTPDTIHVSGLTPSRYYDCYVLPNGGCWSFGGRILTLSYIEDSIGPIGNEIKMCNVMSDLLSYELPAGWTFNDSSRVSLVNDLSGGYRLQMLSPANANDWTTATLSNLSYNALYFVARGIGNGTKLAIGADTITLDTIWQSFVFPAFSPTTISVNGGTGCLLDSVAQSPCPGVDFSIEGNSLTCTVQGNTTYEYILHMTDGIDDQRSFHITTSPFTIDDLQPSTEYSVWWECRYMDNDCLPHFKIRTEAIPLPYCINFENNNSTLPTGWIVTQREGYNDAIFDGTDRMRFSAAYSQWNYIILPEVEHSNHLLLSITGYFSGQDLQVGHLANGVDTTSFVIDTIVPTNGMSLDGDYTFSLNNIGSHHIALRYRGYSLSVQHLGLSCDPKLHFRLLSYNALTLEADPDTSYSISYDYGYGYWTNRTITSSPATLSFSSYSQLYVKQTGGDAACAPTTTFYAPQTITFPYCDEVYNDDLFNIYTTYPSNNSQASFQYIDDRDCYLMKPWSRPVLFILPYLRNSAVGSTKLTFECKVTQANSAIEVGVLTDFLDSSSFIPIDTVVFTGTDWHREYIDLGRYTGNARWIAFRTKSDLLGNSYFYFDNLRLDACYITSTVSLRLERYNEIVIENDSSSEATGPIWVEYGFYGFNRGQGTLQQFDSLPARLVLSPSTTYDIYLYCSNNRLGCDNRYTIRTLDLPLAVPSCTGFDALPVNYTPQGWTAVSGSPIVSSAHPHSGSRSLVLNGTVATPDIDIDTITHLAAGFWVKATQAGAYLIAGCMTSPSDPSSFHPLKTIVPRHIGQWEYHFVSFDQAPINAHYIALRNASGQDNNLFVDDFLLTQCAAFDMQISGISNTAITLSWQQLGNPDATITVLDNTTQSTINYNLSSINSSQLTIPITPRHDYTITTLSSCPAEGMPCATTYTDTINIAVPADGFGCVDPTDLASPQAVFFSGTYNNPYANRGAIDFGPLEADSRHTVNTDTSARDPRTNNLLRTIPKGFTSSVRLGNWSANRAMPEAEGVIYSLRVDTLNFSLLLMQYAAVLQDPMHAPEDQPRFRLELLDSNFNLIDPNCAAADFIANRNLGWNLAPNNVLWKDWTTVGVDLSAYHNRQVYLRLTTYDCNEGSHFGYAYFTLQCLIKNISTTSCGNADSNHFTAPEGFNYRWYTTSNPTTLSTSRTLSVPSSRTTVYLCDLSFLNNSSCSFTLSAYGGSRYPLARVDTIVTYSNCHINVQFVNRSTVSSDGINPVATGEMAETAWWDFGNGYTSDSYNGYTSYDHPGTYTVTLVAGISGGQCTDTLTFPITVGFPTQPSITGPSTLCFGDIDTLRLHNATTPDSLWQTGPILHSSFLILDSTNYQLSTNNYQLTATDPYGCTHTLTHSLHVNPSFTHLDTVYLCSPQLPYNYADTLFLPGTTVLDYHQIGQTTAGCDSSFHLHLRVSPTTAATVFDTVNASICDNETFSFFDDLYNQPGEHMVNHIDSLLQCDSLHSLMLDVRPTSAVDTIANACDQFTWYGTLFTADTVVSKLDTNRFLCDSTTTLYLYVHPTFELTDSIVVCPYQRYLYEGVDYGGPIAFDSPHLTIHNCDSLVHVVLYASDPRFPTPPIVSTDSVQWYRFDTLLLGCQPQLLHLKDTSISTSRTWTVWPLNATDTITSSDRHFHPTLDTTGIFGFRLISVSDEGCRDTVENDSLLWVFPSPQADFIWSPDHLSIHNPHAQFYNQTLPDTCTYLWLFPHDTSASSSDTSFEVNPFYQWEINTEPGDYPVSLIAYLLHYGPDTLTIVCTDTAIIPIYIANTYLQFPNLVTPNGDGINDIWKVVNLLEMGEYSMNELWIYDRWGVLVYHVKDIYRESDFWNPEDTNSPDGTYYFRFMAKNNFGVVKRNGVIEVVR